MAINTKSLTIVANAIAAALDACDKTSADKTPALIAALGGADKASAQAALRPIMAVRYGVECGETKTGKVTVPTDTPEGKRVHNRVAYLCKLAYPETANEREELQVPKAIQALADALAQACAKHKKCRSLAESRRLANTALSAALSNLPK